MADQQECRAEKDYTLDSDSCAHMIAACADGSEGRLSQRSFRLRFSPGFGASVRVLTGAFIEVCGHHADETQFSSTCCAQYMHVYITLERADPPTVGS
jgi:hypothetical protein